MIDLTKLAFVDTETTGLDKGIHRIWEIAIITEEDEHLFQIPLSVDEVRWANPVAQSMTKFAERYQYPIDGYSFYNHDAVALRKAIWRDVYRLTQGRHIVGAVPNFDTERMEPEIKRVGFEPGWHYHLIDVEALAVGWLQGRGEFDLELPWNSKELSRKVGVDPAEFQPSHTALTDARWARALYMKVMES